MNVAVMGTDARAQAIASLLSDAGHDVVPASQKQPATPPVVVLAGPRAAKEPNVRLGDDTVVVDAMDGRATLETERMLMHDYGSQRVVRALIVLPQPGANILCCSDDAEAMATVERLFRSCGCVPTNRGPLANLTELEPPDPRLDEQFDRLRGVNRVSEA
ncbi:MAG TPA: hypothetical protein VJP76_03450 [Candidatus Tumulicola sp.]|nr:hypothetical protein [Candidatus Tumulicola sp.]